MNVFCKRWSIHWESASNQVWPESFKDAALSRSLIYFNILKEIEIILVPKLLLLGRRAYSGKHVGQKNGQNLNKGTELAQNRGQMILTQNAWKSLHKFLFDHIHHLLIFFFTFKALILSCLPILHEGTTACQVPTTLQYVAIITPATECWDCFE